MAKGIQMLLIYKYCGQTRQLSVSTESSCGIEGGINLKVVNMAEFLPVIYGLINMTIGNDTRYTHAHHVPHAELFLHAANRRLHSVLNSA